MTSAHQRMVRVPRLSILVPYNPSHSNLEKPFEDTLASILQYRPTDCEVLVAHAGDYDDPYELSGEVRFLAQRPETSLVELINGGLDRARGEILHVLAPGHTVCEGWTDEARDAFDDPRIGAVVPVIVSEADPGRVVNCGVGYSCGGVRWLAGVGQSVRTIATKTPVTCGPSLAAGFYRTDAVCSLEGFSADVGDSWADIDLALSLRAIGYESLVCASSVIRSCLPPAHEPASYGQGRRAERMFMRHARQLGWLRSMIAHPLSILIGAFAEIPHPGAVTQLLGRLSAWFDRGSLEPYFALLQDAREEAALDEATLRLPTRDEESPRHDADSGGRRAA